jgi:hypothetical protein
MSIIDYFKDLKTLGAEIISESAEANKQLETVKFELGYAKFVAADLQKDIREYQFQAQPRVKVIQDRAEQISKTLTGE